MGYRKYAAIGIVAAMLLAGCSAEVKKSAEKEDIARATEEMTGEVSEDNGSLETSAVDQTYQSDGTQEGCSVSRTFSDYLKREFDIKEIEDEQTYFNSMSSKGQLICRDNVTCSQECLLAGQVADTDGTFIGQSNADWRFYDVCSMMQYSKKDSTVVGGELCMHYETVTIYEYPSTAEAKSIFNSIMTSYENTGVDLSVLSEEEYSRTENEGYFIMSYGLVDQLLGEGGETDTIFREYTTFEAFYFIENRIIRLTYTDTGKDCELMKSVIAELELNDPFTVKSSKEVLDTLTVHIT